MLKPSVKFNILPYRKHIATYGTLKPTNCTRGGAPSIAALRDAIAVRLKKLAEYKR